MAGPWPDIPDWRDSEAYRHLLHAERAAFGWEWLRRRPDYREQALCALSARSIGPIPAETRALEWRLHAFEDPRLPVPLAKPLWTAPHHPWVLPARAGRSRPGDDSFDLREVGKFATLIAGRVQRLLLSNGLHSIRLDVDGATLADGPVRLSFELHGIEALHRPLIVLQRLRSLCLRRRFIASLHPRVRRARRLVMLLRAFDAIGAGASQAAIAEVLLSARPMEEGWRIHSPSLRSQAQRLVRTARQLADGGFWSFLQ